VKDVSTPARAPGNRTTFLRAAGVAGLLTAVLGVVINVILLAPPPEPPTLDTPITDVASYVVETGEMLALGHGLRYLAQVSLIIFGAGVHRLVKGPQDGPHRGWALVGLLATVWVPAVGIIAQSLEGVAVWQAEGLAEQPQLALALWGLSTFLWNSTLVPFSAMILGFSLAGRTSGAFPAWLVALGLGAAAAGLVGAFVTASTAGDGGDIPVGVFFALVSPWVLIVSARMILARDGGPPLCSAV
jgi:hypothetical protein